VPNRPNSRALRAWLIVALWALVVWALGGDSFSAGETSRILRPLIEWLHPDVSSADLHRLLYTARKSAHVTEYALLAVLILRALWLGSLRSLLGSLGLTLLLVAVMAAADERRQSVSALRGGSGWDVLLDVSGGILAIALLLLFQHWQRRPLFRPDGGVAS
jgi:VanZ family protein